VHGPAESPLGVNAVFQPLVSRLTALTCSRVSFRYGSSISERAWTVATAIYMAWRCADRHLHDAHMLRCAPRAASHLSCAHCAAATHGLARERERVNDVGGGGTLRGRWASENGEQAKQSGLAGPSAGLLPTAWAGRWRHGGAGISRGRALAC